jgi:transposase InsO family protein
MSIKKLYLDPFLDMFNGEILSYGISKTPSAATILAAQKRAIEITADCPYRRTFHSDRGWAYQMTAYSYELKQNKIFQSMSRKGNCYDNCIMETFFGRLKNEMYYGYEKEYESFEDFEKAINEYIDYYNNERIQAKTKWMPPVKYREASMCCA